MNWHETIEYIRSKKEYKDLVRDAYFEEDLEININRFGNSEEFKETINYLNRYIPNCKKILDIGAGNGITAVNFALNGYEVHAIEPDPSNTVGAQAIIFLKDKLQLNNLYVYQGYAESLNFKNETFDLVYARQVLHHANDLTQFVKESSRVLKKGGILFTVRDHVVVNQKDKNWFLKSHPLQEFYGGENAYTAQEYRNAIINAKLILMEELKFYDSVINYFPLTKQSKIDLPNQINQILKNRLNGKLGFFSTIPFLFQLYKIKNGYIWSKDYYDENKIPGRVYSYISKKIK